jgi:hypothetical protein
MISQLHSIRPPLPDVPAVYFVSPTLANVRRIAEDLEKSLYESYHLNFVEPLPRALLEELAASVARDGTGDSVEQVCYALNLYAALQLGTGSGSISLIHRPFTFSLLLTACTSAASIANCGARRPSTSANVHIRDPEFTVIDGAAD